MAEQLTKCIDVPNKEATIAKAHTAVLWNVKRATHNYQPHFKWKLEFRVDAVKFSPTPSAESKINTDSDVL